MIANTQPAALAVVIAIGNCAVAMVGGSIQHGHL